MGRTLTDFSQLSKGMFKKSDPVVEVKPLPLSHDSFYPDFVGELTDGRLFAVEYKGEHLRNAKDTLEKDAIGRLWAAKSGGKCLYATVFKSEGGLDVKGQLDKLFANE